MTTIMAAIVFIAVVIAFLTVLTALIIVQHKERQDLYNRIMCRDFAEYRAEPRKDSVKTAHDRVLEQWRKKE